MSNDSIFTTNWNDASEEDTSYTRLSVLALLSMFFGLGSFLVYFTPWFSFMGVIAILLSFIALWAIHRTDGTLTGTLPAQIGLCSAVMALVSIAVFWAAYHYGIHRESDQFFRLWFAAVQQGNIPQAKEYQSIYAQRSKVADAEEWWKTQYKNKNTHQAVHKYVENKLIRCLMALGDQATVSRYKTISVESDREKNTVVSVYAVTFPAESGGTETFFVRIGGKREYPSEEALGFKAAGWKLEGLPDFYLPDEFK
ncbi:MAG: hypothetical protein LBI05_10600 [Planctomycetaceae bacterium]|jgi:hypothetical protein|nr:hypothetical protein [Planctomycetaceae bacterium]